MAINENGAAEALRATVRIDVDRVLGHRDPFIYGHFLESAFFHNIEGGVFDEGSSRSRTGSGPDAGLRQDVIDLCRRLGVPVVRWPGGNFTSSYHWTDGIGSRDRRPRRLNLDWGGEESNRFGTDEFLAWCDAVGAEPFLVHGARDVDDAVRWVEYTNYGGDTELTRQRAANGRAAPYPVRLWGVGNEVYGDWQMGHRSAERYAEDAREHATFMRAVDPGLRLVGVGLPEESWCAPVLAQTRGALDYLSLHLYGASTHLFAGPQQVASEFDAVVAQAAFFEREIGGFSDLLEDLATRLGLDSPPSIALDEWNVRHLEPDDWPEPQPGAGGGIAARELPAESDHRPRTFRVSRYSPRTLADVLCYAGVFHALHRLCGRAAAPTMANTVNLVNANALIEVRPDGALATATYHLWDLYQRQLGETVHPATVDGPSRIQAVRQGDDRTPEGFVSRTEPVDLVDAIATSDHRGRQLALINRSATEAVELSILVDGRRPERATGWSIGSDVSDLFASNSFDRPDEVAVESLGPVDLADGYRLPPHSVTVLALSD